jgi:hypothetical protein
MACADTGYCCMQTGISINKGLLRYPFLIEKVQGILLEFFNRLMGVFFYGNKD